MKSYTTYKKINLPWLKEIPSLWDIVRNKNIFVEMKDEVGDKFSEYTLLSLSLKGIIPRDVESGKGKFPDSFEKYKIVRPGYMVFCLFDMDETPRTVGYSKLYGMVTGAYKVFDVLNINIKYAYYYYLSLDNIKALRPFYTGLRKVIKIDTFLSIKMPRPSFSEQDQIVCFLDWKISEINKLISIKKKQVSFYKELRKALIDEGILYGFQKSRSKESGVYWLGNIPESWEVLPLKRVCKVNASISDIVKTMNDSDLVTFIPMSSVSATGDADYSEKGKIAEFRKNFSSFARGDVVVAKITPCFENGKGACLDKLDTAIGFGTTEFINLRPTSRILSRYLYMITMTRPFRKIGEKFMIGSAGQKRVPANYVKNFTLGIPGIGEQKEILEKIDRKLEQVDELVSAEIQSIKNLQELKITLISDVVTGKIDVRNVEIPEYERVEEDFTEDDSSEMSEEIEKQEG